MRRVIITTESEVFWGGVVTFILALTIGTYALMIALCLYGIYLLFTKPKMVLIALALGGLVLAFTHHPAISGGVVAFVFLVAFIKKNKAENKLLAANETTSQE